VYHSPFSFFFLRHLCTLFNDLALFLVEQGMKPRFSGFYSHKCQSVAGVSKVFRDSINVALVKATYALHVAKNALIVAISTSALHVGIRISAPIVTASTAIRARNIANLVEQLAALVAKVVPVVESNPALHVAKSVDPVTNSTALHMEKDVPLATNSSARNIFPPAINKAKTVSCATNSTVLHIFKSALLATNHTAPQIFQSLIKYSMEIPMELALKLCV
jgi:hypothetical protein